MVRIVDKGNFSMNLAKAINLTKKFNGSGVATCISFLPIEKSVPEQVEKDVSEYRALLHLLYEFGLRSEITIKLHQFGVLDNPKLARNATKEIVECARAHHNFVWIDMERPSTVDITIDVFNELREQYGNVGICLQAYLKRTPKDAEKLLANRVPIRLVKGFYKEHDIADWRAVTEQFSEVMGMILEKSARPCIATHDLSLVARSREIIETNKLQQAEFQFFNGVRDELAVALAQKGFNVRIYIPYGNLLLYLLKGLPTFDNARHVQRLLRFKTVT